MMELNGIVNNSLSNWNERLFNGLKSADIPNLLNLSIVGSYLNDTNLYSNNDIDIVCVFSEYNAQEYIPLNLYMTNLAKSLTIMNILVSVEMRSGPLKPDIPFNNICHVQLHIHAYGLYDWSLVVKYPGCCEWVNNNYHIIGTPLSKLVNPAPISFNAVIRDIIVLKRNIDTHSAYSRVYYLKGNKLINKMKSVLLTVDQYAQMLVSSVFFVFKNMEKAWQVNQKNEKNFIWPNKYIELKDEVNIIKLQLKNGDHNAVEKALKIQNDISNFLFWALNEILDIDKK